MNSEVDFPHLPEYCPRVFGTWAILPQLREINLTIHLDASHYLYNIPLHLLAASYEIIRKNATCSMKHNINLRTRTKYRPIYSQCQQAYLLDWNKLVTVEWPWTAKSYVVTQKMRLLEPIVLLWMKTDPYYQRQKCRPMPQVSIRPWNYFRSFPTYAITVPERYRRTDNS